jgi:transposase, IS30 family
VLACLYQLWSPEKISGRLKRFGLLSISHETIYRYIWTDRAYGGGLHTYLRQAGKQLRKRYGRYDSRGRLAGKRHISERPAGADNLSRMGYLEGDTIIGTFDRHCALTPVCRETGYTMIGKLYGRTTESPLPVHRRAAVALEPTETTTAPVPGTHMPKCSLRKPRIRSKCFSGSA